MIMRAVVTISMNNSVVMIMILLIIVARMKLAQLRHH